MRDSQVINIQQAALQRYEKALQKERRKALEALEAMEKEGHKGKAWHILKNHLRRVGVVDV
jgi:uncharacterized protein YbjQ (UPF0145 family)